MSEPKVIGTCAFTVAGEILVATALRDEACVLGAYVVREAFCPHCEMKRLAWLRREESTFADLLLFLQAVGKIGPLATTIMRGSDGVDPEVILDRRA